MTVKLPEEVAALLNDPTSVKVLTTVAADGTPHSIRVGSMGAPAPSLISVGAVLMKTSNANLEATKKANKLICILVNTEMKAYLITATVKDNSDLRTALRRHQRRIEGDGPGRKPCMDLRAPGRLGRERQLQRWQEDRLNKLRPGNRPIQFFLWSVRQGSISAVRSDHCHSFYVDPLPVLAEG